MRSGTHEFSKVMVRRTLLVFLIHMMLTILSIFLRAEIAPSLVGLMNATVPVYIVIFGGYFGKAGIENYQKIKNEAADCDTDEESQEAEYVG